MKRKDEPNKVKEMPTAPLVLIMVTGLVAKLAELVAGKKKSLVNNNSTYNSDSV